MAQPTECPNCGKKGLIQRGGDLYQCLSCDFSRDLSKTEPGLDVTKILVFGLLLTIFFRAIGLIESYRRPAYSNQGAEAQVQPVPSREARVY